VRSGRAAEARHAPPTADAVAQAGPRREHWPIDLANLQWVQRETAAADARERGANWTEPNPPAPGLGASTSGLPKLEQLPRGLGSSYLASPVRLSSS